MHDEPSPATYTADDDISVTVKAYDLYGNVVPTDDMVHGHRRDDLWSLPKRARHLAGREPPKTIGRWIELHPRAVRMVGPPTS